MEAAGGGVHGEERQQAGGLPGRAAAQIVAFEQQGRPARPGQVIGDAAADGAAADHHHPRFAPHRAPPAAPVRSQSSRAAARRRAGRTRSGAVAGGERLGAVTGRSLTGRGGQREAGVRRPGALRLGRGLPSPRRPCALRRASAAGAVATRSAGGAHGRRRAGRAGAGNRAASGAFSRRRQKRCETGKRRRDAVAQLSGGRDACSFSGRAGGELRFAGPGSASGPEVRRAPPSCAGGWGSEASRRWGMGFRPPAGACDAVPAQAVGLQHRSAAQAPSRGSPGRRRCFWRPLLREGVASGGRSQTPAPFPAARRGCAQGRRPRPPTQGCRTRTGPRLFPAICGAGGRLYRRAAMRAPAMRARSGAGAGAQRRRRSVARSIGGAGAQWRRRSAVRAVPARGDACGRGETFGIAPAAPAAPGGRPRPRPRRRLQAARSRC